LPSRRATLTVAVLVAAVALVLDQATKAWAAASLPEARTVTAISGWLWFHLAHNSGATLGLLSGHSQLVGALSLVIVLAVAVLLVQGHPGGYLGAAALGAIAGGAVGNLLDRLRMGSVVDFIEIRVWPTDFNLADAAIRIGVVLFVVVLLVDLIRGRRRTAAVAR
jgi:signal peptidase II